MEHALDRAVIAGYSSVFLCGEPKIYRKMGFRPSCEYAVFHKDDPKAQWCMGRELIDNSLKDVSGKIDIV